MSKSKPKPAVEKLINRLANAIGTDELELLGEIFKTDAVVEIFTGAFHILAKQWLSSRIPDAVPDCIKIGIEIPGRSTTGIPKSVKSGPAKAALLPPIPSVPIADPMKPSDEAGTSSEAQQIELFPAEPLAEPVAKPEKTSSKAPSISIPNDLSEQIILRACSAGLQGMTSSALIEWFNNATNKTLPGIQACRSSSFSMTKALARAMKNPIKAYTHDGITCVQRIGLEKSGYTYSFSFIDPNSSSTNPAIVSPGQPAVPAPVIKDASAPSGPVKNELYVAHVLTPHQIEAILRDNARTDDTIARKTMAALWSSSVMDRSGYVDSQLPHVFRDLRRMFISYADAKVPVYSRYEIRVFGRDLGAEETTYAIKDLAGKEGQ